MIKCLSLVSSRILPNDEVLVIGIIKDASNDKILDLGINQDARNDKIFVISVQDAPNDQVLVIGTIQDTCCNEQCFKLFCLLLLSGLYL